MKSILFTNDPLNLHRGTIGHLDVRLPHAVRVPDVEDDDLGVVALALLEPVPPPVALADARVGVAEHPRAQHLQAHRVHGNLRQELGLPAGPDGKDNSILNSITG